MDIGCASKKPENAYLKDKLSSTTLSTNNHACTAVGSIVCKFINIIHSLFYAYPTKSSGLLLNFFFDAHQQLNLYTEIY